MIDRANKTKKTSSIELAKEILALFPADLEAFQTRWPLRPAKPFAPETAVVLAPLPHYAQNRHFRKVKPFLQGF